jgi:hypothetical protein
MIPTHAFDVDVLTDASGSSLRYPLRSLFQK